MDILFLTLARIDSIETHGIYQDLIRKFRDEGHNLIVLGPSERRFNKKTYIISEKGCQILNVWTPNIQKTNILEKALGTFVIDFLFLKAFNKYFKNVNLDLILYSTPPITFSGVIKEIKFKTGAKTYLLLKDIFPQNAVDLGILKKNSLIFNYFRRKEIELYLISDWIGCMSKFNKRYLLDNNKYLDKSKVEINPNSIYIDSNPISDFEINLSNQFDQISLPNDKILFIYGGNLGQPQGIDFLLDIILDSEANNKKAYFIIVGSGTEKKRVSKWFHLNNPKNALLLNEMPQNDYNQLLKRCHVGMVFLHPNFTIPNYPSRILSYMENYLPIIFATDENTDVGFEAVEFNYGYWSKSGDLIKIRESIGKLIINSELRIQMGQNGYNRLFSDFNVNNSYSLIVNRILNN